MKIPVNRLIPRVDEIRVGEEAYISPHNLIINTTKEGWLPKSTPVLLPGELNAPGVAKLRIRRMPDGIGVYISELDPSFRWLPYDMLAGYRKNRFEEGYSPDLASGTEEEYMREQYLPVTAWTARQMLEQELQDAVQKEDFEKAAYIREGMKKLQYK
jgi:hypothetical protein